MNKEIINTSQDLKEDDKLIRISKEVYDKLYWLCCKIGVSGDTILNLNLELAIESLKKEIKQNGL